MDMRARRAWASLGLLVVLSAGCGGRPELGGAASPAEPTAPPAAGPRPVMVSGGDEIICLAPEEGSARETSAVGGGTARAKQGPPAARPYRRGSLKGLTDAEIVAYMGRGKTVWGFEHESIVPSHVPDDFWAVPPRQAALAFAEANRTEASRGQCRLAMGDPKGARPPDACTVYYSYRSRRCYFTSDSRWFLRVDPNGSFLACSRVQGLGVVFYNVVEARSLYDLRRADLAYEDARHLAQALWWLRRLEAPVKYGSHSFSSADGTGALRMTWDAGDPIEVEAGVWAGSISSRWTGGADDEAYLRLADHLFQVALPDRLGEAWDAQAPARDSSLYDRALHRRSARPIQQEDAALTAREAAQARNQVARLIDLFSADGSRLPHAILADAVRAAGDFALAEFAPQLRAMQEGLAPPAAPVRTRSQVDREWREAMDRARTGPGPDDSDRLFDELRSLRHGVIADAAREELRQAIEVALRKMDAADDAERLLAWAKSDADGWQWALQRLRRIDRPRYVAALEDLLRWSTSADARQVFDALVEADPARARELARQIPPDHKGDLTVSAFSVLEQANAIEDRDRRIDALLAVALDPKSDWSERGDAIRHLVPKEEPLRYPDAKIDDALVRLFDPSLADDLINFTLVAACDALARRDRLACFGPMLQLFDTETDGQVRNDLLPALARLARSGGREPTARLAEVLGRHLRQRDRDPSAILPIVYALDLRGFRDDLEVMATAGPEDYEGTWLFRPGDEAPPPRWHMARKVAALWNEPDAATRGRMLVAFCLGDGWYKDSIRETTLRQLTDLVRASPPGLAQRLADLAGKRADEILRGADPDSRDGLAELAQAVKKALRPGG